MAETTADVRLEARGEVHNRFCKDTNDGRDHNFTKLYAKLFC